MGVYRIKPVTRAKIGEREQSEISEMASFLPEDGKVMTLMQCPNDVLEKVISFLPVPDVFRLRTVCKEWNEIITARAFQETGQLRFNKLELIAVCNVDPSSNSREFKAYDVEAEKWHSFDLSFLPDDREFCVLDFAGCLACVKQKSHMERVLYICNPLTKMLARLPLPPTSFNSSSSQNVIVRMYYCNKTGHYKVFMVSGLYVNPSHSSPLFNRLVVEEFDSSSWTWAMHSQICHPFSWEEMMGAGVLPCNNENGVSLFVLLYRKFSRDHHRRQLFALLFDKDNKGLGFVKIEASLPGNLLNPRLVYSERRSHPLLVSAVGDQNGVRGVEIWELDNKVTEWRNLAAMPSDFLKYFRSPHGKRLVEWRQSIRNRIFLRLEAQQRFTAGLLPTVVVAVAYKHLVYIHPRNDVPWTIAFDTLKRSWRCLTTMLPPQITITNFSPHIAAFEPSLANVVSTDGPN